MATRALFCTNPGGTMPPGSPNSPLGDFIAALHEEKIDVILIGMMAAIVQGAPMMTIDYDFWVRLPERQYVRLLKIIQRQGGTIRAQTLYELSDGTQVNVIFQPDGLQSFEQEFRKSRVANIQGQRLRILPLDRIIASKRASGREKDLAALPVLEKTARLSRRLKPRKKPGSQSIA